MNVEISKLVIISNLFWKLIELGGTQGVQFIVQVVLARILLPADYGILAITVIFITIAGVFVQSGLNTALIQKKNIDEVDYSSVFYFSLAVAGVLYVVIFFTAPQIAIYFQEPKLVSVLRVLALILFLGAFQSVQNAVIARNMQFKKLFLCSIGAIVISGIASIVMAYSGFGVWALVVQQLIQQSLTAVFLFLTVKWRPTLIFSLESAKSLLSYGWKLLVSTLISNMTREIRSILIGKLYRPESLAFYTRGQQFPLILAFLIDGSIQAVMLPTLSSQQDNKQRVKTIVKRSIVTSSFFILPMMIGLAVIAKPLIMVVLTEKWMPCVPFLQIYCLIYALWPLQTANLQAIKSLGHSDIFLKLEIVKSLITLAILSMTVHYGIYAIAMGAFISAIASYVVNSYPNRKLLDYGIWEQTMDIMPPLILSLGMGAVVYSIEFLNLSSLVTLIIQVILGVAVYLMMCKLFRLESFEYIKNTIKELVKKHTE